ncbi:MAG: helix-turn-helix domain-containing protein [Cyclobacteriaceae bacterium]|jgi:transcriptional regulator with XRE-family HTH domain|nr:helix-turn-helix domain-containing protein [Cyclobacteriaceae bacterium]
MESIAKLFGKVLKDHRKKKGLSQDALATDSDLDRTYISQLERGRRTPSIETLFKIAQALGVTASGMIREVEKLGGTRSKSH